MLGKYIVIEGGEGAGKDTQIELLKKHFGGNNFVYTREPGGTRLGKEIREILLHQKYGEVTNSAELFLFFADRAQHIEEVIKPALAAGKTVISNRSYISFLAYQIYGRQQFEWQEAVEQMISKLYTTCPIDIAVILDIAPAEAFKRLHAAGKNLDRIEQAGPELHERIRAAFLSIAPTVDSVVFDADRPIEEVWTDVRKAVESVL